MKNLFIAFLLAFLITFSVKAIENTPFSTEIEVQDTEEVNTQAKTFSKDEVVEYKTYKISNIDKTKDKPNELNIYTPLFGKSTNTDKKGFEAVVVNNRVVKLNQYNSYIPQNGYVISGHGKAKKFITKYFFEGADVNIDFDKLELKIAVHPDNYLYAAIYRHDKMQALLRSIERDRMQTLIVNQNETVNHIDTFNMSFFINRSGDIIERTKKLVQFHDYDNAQKMAQDSILYSDKALYYSLAYNPDEVKGIYIFPYQKTKDEIDQAFDTVQRLNIDSIFINGYFNGLTIYKSEVNKAHGLPEQNHYYKDFDVIAEWVKIAKENNKKIYISVDAFDVGRPPKSSIKKNIVKVHKKWLVPTAKNENYVLNAENAEVQEYLLELIDELSSKYEITGINIKGLNIDKQQAGIDKFINKVIVYKKNNPNLELMINIYPNKTDISNWNLDKTITLLPVLTSPDDDFAIDFLRETIQKSKSAQIYPIYIEPYLEEKPAKLFDQITIARKLNLKGIILYNIDYMDKAYFDALKCSIFREPSTKKQQFLYDKDEQKAGK